MAHPSAAELAEDLVAAELALLDTTTPPEHLGGWAHAQQAAYRQLALTPGWQAEVGDAVPEAMRDSFDDNLEATTELFALTKPRDELPDAWVIVAPPPADELLDAYREAAAAEGIDWSYLAAIHLTETRMGRIRGTSTAGAQGPMQFMPATWDAYGEGDVHDPHDAIRAAARYLAAHGAPADMDGAIWAYNHSDRYVAAVQAYARVLRREPRAYLAYHGWQVYYRLSTGDVVLPEGWSSGDAPTKS